MALLGVDMEDDGVIGPPEVAQGRLEGRLVVALLEVAVVEAERAEDVVGACPPRGAQLGEVAVDAAVVGRESTTRCR